MNCPRPGCNGLLVPETVYDGNLAMDLHRCVSCGRMGKPDERLQSDDLSHTKGHDMPGAWTPERRAKFEATIAAKKGQAPKQKPEQRAVVPVVQEAVMIEREPMDFSALDVVIEETRKDLDALERTKEILARRS